MYRNSTVGSLPLGLSRRFLTPCCSALLACLLAVCGVALLSGSTLKAQSTSGGGIQGTVVDPSGAGVPKAEITATNTDTGVQTKKISGNTGTYSMSPLQAGNYNVEVTAKGFQRLLQENVTIDNASMFGLTLKLTVGGENTTVTVTDAPPFLNTTDATLGGTIENELYSELPLSMNGGPRDPTAFQYLMPGVQENPNNNTGTGSTQAIGTSAGQDSSGNYVGGNAGIYGGTGQTNLGENYIEGVPVSNIAQQGSSNPISSAVSVDAVDQFSVQTSGASTSFSGAGSTNFTIKAGGNQFHGSAVDYIRNTMFDTWGYFAKVPLSSSGAAVKPGEHQNQYDISIGGPIFKDKLFFFADYSGFHYTTTSNTPQYITIPTMAERRGDFTDLFGTTLPEMRNPVLGGFGSQTPFQGLVNGVPTYNVIEPQYISSISKYMQAALPTPTNLSTFQNYLAALPKENSDYSIDARLDYTLNSRNKFSLVGVGGNVGYGGQPFYTTPTQLPTPYAGGQFTNQKTASGVFSYVYIASQTLINSLKYGYSRNWGQGFSLTAHQKSALMPLGESASAAGIQNLPTGNAADNMPSVSFTQGNGPTAPFGWASNSSTGPQASNSYSVIDNLQWIKGRHNITFGAQVQWLQSNGAAFGGFSKSISLEYSAYDTNICVPSSIQTCVANGDAYASYLVGAVYSGNVTTQAITDAGARYRPMAPYVQDNWQVSSKLTLNLGFRYDYLQPFHEVHNRISFLNPTTINPIVGIPGVVEFAGFPDIKNFKDIPANGSVPAETAAQALAIYSPYICHCTTPVHPYNKNFEPRVGFAYAANPATVFSGAFAITYTHAGGVGGGSSATVGTGNSGEFSASNSTSQSGSTGDPGFYLNPGLQSAPPTQQSSTGNIQGTQPTAINGVSGPPITCNNGLTGLACTLSAMPPWTIPGQSVNPLQSTGNYDYANLPDTKNDYGCSTGGGGAPSHCSPGTVNFADPYYGGRGPQYISYNFSVQRMINKKAVLTIAYAGSQTHFLPGGSGRGYATNTYSPDFAQLYKNNLTAGGQSNPNVSPYPGASSSCAACQSWDGGSTGFAASLRPFPQFGSMRDLWGSTGNSSSNALQISIIQRPWHNLSGLVNYTRAKELDDTGRHRTQFPVGPQDGNFTKNYTANQIDRGLGTTNQTNAFNVTWVYSFPIGRGQAFFATNRIAGLIGGGWQFSGIYRYRDGYPLTVTLSSCNTGTNAGQGTCFPDYTPGFDKRRARINGRWGRGPGANAANVNTISYVNAAAFQCPDSSPLNLGATCGATNSPTASWKLGNLARSAPDGLHGPGWWEVQLGLRRTFNVRETATLHLTFQLEADVDNATNSTFFNIGGTQSTSSGFGTVSGQNKSILPRDWQFAGRFRF